MSILSCSAPGCEAPAYIKKKPLCRPHYNRFMAYGDFCTTPALSQCKECRGAISRDGAKTGPPAEYCSYDCKRAAAYRRRLDSGGYERDKEKRRAEFTPKPLTPRPCRSCGEAFSAKRDEARFCSTRCNTTFRRTNHDGSCSTSDCHRTSEARGLCIVCWKRAGRASGQILPEPWNERRKANSHKRRAQKLGTRTELLRPIDIYERDIWLCGLCSTAVDPDAAWPDPMSPSLDHILPLSKGGAHTYENVQLAHLTCNVSKGNRVAA